MLDRASCARAVIDADAGEVRRARAQEHDRDVQGSEARDVAGIRGQADDQRTVDPASHSDMSPGRVWVFQRLRDVQQQVDVVGLEALLHSGEHLGEVPPPDIRRDDADRAGTPGSEPGRGGRHRVVHLEGERDDSVPRSEVDIVSPRNARDTVAEDTPAARATSRIVRRGPAGSLRFPGGLRLRLSPALTRWTSPAPLGHEDQPRRSPVFGLNACNCRPSIVRCTVSPMLGDACVRGRTAKGLAPASPGISP